MLKNDAEIAIYAYCGVNIVFFNPPGGSPFFSADPKESKFLPIIYN